MPPSASHSPGSGRLQMADLALPPVSASLHVKTQRFRTTSTCLCPCNSFDDSNVACFSMMDFVFSFRVPTQLLWQHANRTSPVPGVECVRVCVCMCEVSETTGACACESWAEYKDCLRVRGLTTELKNKPTDAPWKLLTFCLLNAVRGHVITWRNSHTINKCILIFTISAWQSIHSSMLTVNMAEWELVSVHTVSLNFVA